MKYKELLSTDLKEAMKARDQVRVDTLRAILSAFIYKRTETGKEELTDDEELAVLTKQMKQRNDSISEFTKAGRHELVEKESKERDILAKYLPAQKSATEIREAVRKVIQDAQPTERNQGAMMKVIMPMMKGVADGTLVREIVTEELKKL